jgi:hypothetical protein
MYLDIHLNVVGSYGSSPSFLAPDSTYGRLDICNMMCPGLAGGSGLELAIVDADAYMPPEGLPVASERQVVRADALGSNERQGK